MCGFVGVVTWDGRFAASREQGEILSACIAHRGPDGQGLHVEERAGAHVLLGHRRLAILDPDPRSDQPFTDGQGRWLAFNGEIYNFREMRSELEALDPSYAWRTAGDTEVLLRAYAAWGESCLSRLNGMYAFAAWDGRALFLARDRMGQKPLYLARDPSGGLAFASELPPLLKLPWVDASIEPVKVVEYLRWGFVARGTVFRGIDKLPPATWMKVTAAGTETGAYFDPNDPLPVAAMDGRDAVERTRQLVRQAVRRQLVSDVPLGCFLSGGIDSSIIAASMVRAAGSAKDVLTFSIGFDEARYDETPHAREVARHLGTRHHEFIVRPDAAADLPKLAATFGEPFGDSSALPTHYLARETRRQVKVALSGDGGDELFGGYDRYRAMAMGAGLGPVGRAMLRLADRAAGRFGGGGDHPKGALSRLRRFAASIDAPEARRYASYLRLFDDATLDALLHGDLRAKLAGDDDEPLASAYAHQRGRGRGVVEAALATDRALYLPEDLLAKVDRCSMLHALEVRSPFMDHELVAFAATVPEALLTERGRGKRLLREAFAAELPAGVFRRRKMGFAVPIGEFFRGQLRGMLEATLAARDGFAASHLDAGAVRRLLDEHHAQRRDHSQRLYALLMLDLWWAARQRVR